MDPLRILARVLLSYVLLLILMRAGGKRLVRHASPLDFALSVIIGDMIDDLLWAEVDASVFVVGVGVLLLIHVALDLVRFRAMSWR
jgi:uncharacterized membrane protein YcaP (DUF421 family)